jgi:hypothetical protein
VLLEAGAPTLSPLTAQPRALCRLGPHLRRRTAAMHAKSPGQCLNQIGETLPVLACWPTTDPSRIQRSRRAAFVWSHCIARQGRLRLLAGIRGAVPARQGGGGRVETASFGLIPPGQMAAALGENADFPSPNVCFQRRAGVPHHRRNRRLVLTGLRSARRFVLPRDVGRARARSRDRVRPGSRRGRPCGRARVPRRVIRPLGSHREWATDS